MAAEQLLAHITAASIAIAAVLYTLVMKKLVSGIRGLVERAEEEQILRHLTNHQFYRGLAFLVRASVFATWFAALYFVMGLYEPLGIGRQQMADITHTVYTAVAVSVFTRPLFRLGDQDVTLQFLLVLTLLVAAVAVASGFARTFMRRQLLSRLGLDVGIQEALATAGGYLVLAVGLLVAFEIAGVDLSTLAVIAGALSIGVGFGLQNIANNFISGLILLIERPIKVGDRIEVGSVHGRVVRISARSTAVRTNDNIDIIVPNSELVSDRVVNWSQKDRRVRFRIPVGVSYETDVELALDLMTEAAEEIPDVLSASARFLSFGDSALELEARIWTSRRLHRRGLIISEVNLAILRKFREHGIEVPFPQRDVHIKSHPAE